MHHREIETLARGDTFVHRLDPRVKLAVVILFTALLVATPRYALARLAPFAVIPAFLLVFADVPARLVLQALTLMAPFVLLVAIWNPIVDRRPLLIAWGATTIQISAGWVSLANILLRFILAAAALVALMASTPFAKLLEGLRRLGLPRMFVTVLAFVHRYLFELVDVGLRMRRARALRGGAPPFAARVKSSAGILANLFVRSLDRSDRIYKAMLARGFEGEIRPVGTLRMRAHDWVFLGAAGVLLVAIYAFATGRFL